MPLFTFSPCSFSLANGDKLYSNIQLTLDSGLSALIGRNGSGKSVLAAQLAQQLASACYLLPQLPPPLWQQLSLGDLLGISDKLNALQQLADGQCDTETLSIIDGHWQLADDLCRELQQINVAPDVQQCCGSLSGGQLNHLRLWWAFYQQRPLLILDEPSNHLDAAGRNWLSQKMADFLARPNSAILLISHDRQLLQHVTVIHELSGSGLTRYGGNYEFYQQQHLLQHCALQQQRQQAERKVAQQQRQAQAAAERAAKRQQQGEKRRGSQAAILLDYQKNRAQTAASARRTQEQQQQKHARQQLQQLKAQQEVIKAQQFYLCAAVPSCTKKRLIASGLQLAYGHRQPLNFHWHTKQRVHVQGRNGSGKSTLLQTLAGTVAPASGLLHCNSDVQYLDQHFSLLKPELTALDNLRRHCPTLTITTARTLLASAGFRADNALKPTAVLSGGERMKLAMLMVSQHGNSLLLLDEPDNHLDLAAKQLLAQALCQYQAGFVVVSHDQYFIDQLGIDTVLQL